jgi:hypothetical protein
VLNVPVEVLMKIDSIRRAFLCVSSDEVTGGRCKVNWDLVCKLKDYGGLGILNLNNFASALRMRWLLHEWKDETKHWVRLGNPCTTQDKEVFAVATIVTIGGGKKVFFWEAPWLIRRCPKDIAPSYSNSPNTRNASSTRRWKITFGLHKSTCKMALLLST